MRSLLVDLVLVVVSLIAAALCLRGAYKAKSDPGRVLAIVLGSSVIVACLYYYSRTGRTVDETVACLLFSGGKGCPSRPAADPEMPSRPPPKSEPARESPPPANSAVQTLGGWWPRGTPAAPSAALVSEEALWSWVERHPESCQPLRQYIGFFPDGRRAAAARARLANEKQRVDERWVLAREQIAGASRSGAFAVDHPQGQACRSLVSGYSNSLLASFCSGIGDGREAAGSDTIEFLGVDAVMEPGGCTCSDRWFAEGKKCTAKFQRSCLFQTKRRSPVELCPDPS